MCSFYLCRETPSRVKCILTIWSWSVYGTHSKIWQDAALCEKYLRFSCMKGVKLDSAPFFSVFIVSQLFEFNLLHTHLLEFIRVNISPMTIPMQGGIDHLDKGKMHYAEKRLYWNTSPSREIFSLLRQVFLHIVGIFNASIYMHQHMAYG